MNKFKEFFIKYFRDITLILAIAVCSLGTILIVRCATRKNPISAVIYHQNDVVLTIDLTKESDDVREIKFPKEEINIVIGVKKNAICILRSDCPHQDCVNMGWTSSPDRPIICAHYKVSIQITGAASYDAEIG